MSSVNESSNIVWDDEGGKVALYRCFTLTSTVISVPFNILAMYLITTKSGSALKLYKYFLLNILIWVFLYDLVMEVIFLPLPVMDIFGLYSTGLASSFGPQVGFASLVLVSLFLPGYLGALLLAFLYRYNVTKDKKAIFGYGAMGSEHPNVYKLVDKLLDEQVRVKAICAKLAAGEDSPLYSRKEYEIKNRKLLSIIEAHDQMPADEYLEACGNYVVF
ncbi:hypothetical protein QR680_015605 [Steinernema hermaphroditum]|uniref:Uncharacterized protein n=1 Tax=Steinernema hermaphroditum TaxID=289476 RepID=A0AA39LL22_9BILA|nr:hypothetical protein QR680_015605 [Steinernema hermaphroditum]